VLNLAADNTAMTAIDAVWSSAESQNLAPAAQAQAVLAAMQANPQFVASGISSDNNVWGRFQDGLVYAVCTGDTNVDGFTQSPQLGIAPGGSILPSFWASIPGKTTLEVPAVFPAPGDLPGSPKAYVFNSVESFRQIPSAALASELAAAGFSVTSGVGGLADWQTMNSAGILFVGTHGGPWDATGGGAAYFLMSGEVFQYPDVLQDLVAPLSQGHLAIWNAEFWDAAWNPAGPTPKHHELRYAFDAEWLKSHASTTMFAHNSLMFLEACSGMSDYGEYFGNFLGQNLGLGLYGGWSLPVKCFDGNETSSFFFDRALGLNLFAPIDLSKPPPGDWSAITGTMSSTPRASGVGYNLNQSDEGEEVGMSQFSVESVSFTSPLTLRTLIPSIASYSLDLTNNLITLKGSFGSQQGTVLLAGNFLTIQSWAAGAIIVTLPTTTKGNLLVTSPQGLKSNLFPYTGPQAPTLTPASVNLATPQQTAAFSVALSGYDSSTLTYQWGPSAYGTLTDGCGHTGTTVTCQGTPTVTYALTGTTLPDNVDNFAVQVLDAGGNSLGTTYGSVSFYPTTLCRFTGGFSGNLIQDGNPSPTSISLGTQTPPANGLSAHININDYIDLELGGTWTGSSADLMDTPEDGSDILLSLSGDWNSLSWSQANPARSGTLTRATMDCPNLTGQTWTSTEVINASNCGMGTYTVHNTYTITQAGLYGWLLWPYCKIFTATESSGIALSLNAGATSVMVSGSYPLKSGITTLTPSLLNLSADGTTYSGTVTWSWKGPAGSCGGTTQFTAVVTQPAQAGLAEAASITPRGGALPMATPRQ
jgi:hypothetical protein